MNKLLNLCIGRGQPKKGVEFGPIVLNQFFKNVISSTNINCYKTAHYKALASYHISKNESKLFTIGGDHSIAISSVSAFKKVYKKGGVVWIDAHADINTPKTSPSGNLHGMPVSFLMGLSENHEFDFLKDQNKLQHNEIFYIGVRDIDPMEKKILDRLGIKYSKHYDKNELDNWVSENKFEDLHISFDVDALDPSLVCSTGTPVPDGLHTDDIKDIWTRLKNKTKSIDIVEYNPEIGDHKKSLVVMNDIINFFIK